MMRRSLARFVFVTLLGGLAMLLGVVTSMTLTPPGRDLLARTVSEGLDRVLIGHVDVGGISGSFLYDLKLERLVVRDTQGVLLADLPRVHVTYRIPNLLAGRIVLGSVQVQEPVINLVKHRGGRMNYQEVLGIGSGKKGTGRSPLVEFFDVQVTGGTLRIALPWDPPHGATPRQADSALAAERAKPGRQIVLSPHDGLQRILRFEQLTTVMPRMVISTPDHQPFTLDLDTLATRVSDPQVVLRDARGRLRFRGDSVVFGFTRAALPRTVVSGGGAVTWPRDTTLFDFALDAPQADLRDLKWISPDFPDFRGRARLLARSVSGARTEYTLRDLSMRSLDGAQRVDGALVAVTDRQLGLGVRDMTLKTENLDLAVAHAYIDSLPFYGTLSGTTRGSGWLLGRPLDLTVDWAFADAKVPGRPVSYVRGDGRVIVSQAKDSGLTFAGFQVRQSDVDLGTVRRIAPAVILEGRLAAQGRLTGPLRNVTFEGTATHRDDGRPPSVADGRLHLDTRGKILGLNADVDLAPLAFEGIRRTFPTLAARGEVRGHVTLDGTLERMAVRADLAGEIGHVVADGYMTMDPPHWAAEDLLLRFSGLDLAALRGVGPATRLDGSLRVTGSIDTLRAPEGALELALDRSRVREWLLDTLYARAAVADSVIRLDTLLLGWRGARAGGSGTLGWAAPHDGTMRFTVNADSLVGFDSLALAVTGMTRDTGAFNRELAGQAAANVTLSGSLDSLRAEGEGVARGLEFQQFRTPELRGAFTWAAGGDTTFTARLAADTFDVAKRRVRAAALALAGRPDSLGWSVGGDIGLTAHDTSRVDATGTLRTAADSARGERILAVDTLAASLASHRWRLAQPVGLRLADSTRTLLTPVALVAADGSGAVHVAGRLPGASAGDLRLDAVGIDLRDVWSLLQRDTTGVGGSLALNLHVAGTAAAPTISGTASLGESRFGESRTPFARASVDYADRRLDATLRLWRTGEPVVDVRARLPLDLALTRVPRRQLPGPLFVRALADSMDLAVLEAATPAVREVSGVLSADVQVEGTWAQPRLAGSVDLHGGAMSLPGLGIRLDTVRGHLALAGDSVALRDVYLTSGEGRLDASGLVRLDSLTKPVLAVDLKADRFHAINVRDFLDLTATGDVHLRGPILKATMTGHADADRGVFHFDDIITKRVIDLEDPTNLDVVDTAIVRARGLGAAFQNRFLDSLRIVNFQFGVGGDFWLRSNEANIQLTGRDLLVNKTRREYVIDGTLAALRGTYNLQIGPVSREFTVQEGRVTYEGTPDLNATLDIQARHDVRALNNQVVPVIANITGTLRQPKLELTSGPGVQPPLPEVDLVSYLILGVPSSQAQGAQLSAVQNVTSYLTSALSNEFERALISDVGFPIDMLEIRPSIAFGAQQSTVTQLIAGWQIGQKVFFTVNTGFCSQAAFSLQRNIGAGIELRFSEHWRTQLSFEPTFQECGVRALGRQLAPTTNYQVGTDVFWEREF
ncbi:MAG TPA: translocation/assembly module TamB domain-containing protein [Gemmatimonadales bacterium]|nr:translocation/assembly module TamB domain-containing protein [Gemmatimonadales bacterium]